LPASHQRVEDNQALQLTFEGNPVRAIKDAEGKPWFVGADVCAILGYSDAPQAIRQHCKSAELLKNVKTTFLDIPSRGMLIINRADVYRLIMRSQLPAAERFESGPGRQGPGRTGFVARDVCAVLGFAGDPGQNTRALDNDGKGLTILQPLGGPEKMATVSELGRAVSLQGPAGAGHGRPGW